MQRIERKLSNVSTNVLFLFPCVVVLSGLALGAPADSFAKIKKGGNAAKAASAVVDLHPADQKAIAALPGIGEKTARRFQTESSCSVLYFKKIRLSLFFAILAFACGGCV